MVEQTQELLDAVFKALADPTRRAMLATLAKGERTVGELAAPHEMSFAGASKHVAVLEQAGLVTRRIEGREHRIALEARAMRPAARFLDAYRRFWTARLDDLEAALERGATPSPRGTKTKSRPPGTHSTRKPR